MDAEGYQTGFEDGQKQGEENMRHEIKRQQSIIHSLLFWISHGKFDHLDTTAVEHMNGAVKTARAALKD